MKKQSQYKPNFKHFTYKKPRSESFRHRVNKNPQNLQIVLRIHLLISFLHNLVQFSRSPFSLSWYFHRHAESAEFAGYLWLVGIELEATDQIIHCLFLIVFAQIIVSDLPVNLC